MGTVHQFKTKRSFTTAEAVIDTIRDQIFRDGRPYHEIAKTVGVSGSTVRNLASGKTQWPRPTTLFPLIRALGLELTVMKKGRRL